MRKLYFTFLIFFILIFKTNSFENSKLESEILQNIRCLVCQGQSIADSNSDFAQTIKLVVKDQIDEGNTKKEIYNFLISKYGEWIIFEPRLNKTNFLLWFLPYLTLVLGAFIILIMVRKGKKTKLY
jgi:cytochrome c-type biogenesis protein CcmH